MCHLSISFSAHDKVFLVQWWESVTQGPLSFFLSGIYETPVSGFYFYFHFHFCSNLSWKSSVCVLLNRINVKPLCNLVKDHFKMNFGTKMHFILWHKKMTMHTYYCKKLMICLVPPHITLLLALNLVFISTLWRRNSTITNGHTSLKYSSFAGIIQVWACPSEKNCWDIPPEHEIRERFTWISRRI